MAVIIKTTIIDLIKITIEEEIINNIKTKSNNKRKWMKKKL